MEAITLVQRACRKIEQSPESPPSLSALSGTVGMSPHHLHRTFKRVMGITPKQYADACRLSTLKSRLRSEDSVGRAVFEAGFSSSSRLYERAPTQLGMTPAAYRRGGEGMRIGYALVSSPLGRLLVGATERGVCAVCLGDDDEKLESGLTKEYPAAVVTRDDAALAGHVDAILRHLRGEVPHADLPLDVQATAFQWRVWRELQAIPYGETRSYSEIARAIGRPSAVRAVANACARNRAALVIPCHRAVREGGGLGGYRWGVERKKALLAKEAEGARDRE